MRSSTDVGLDGQFPHVIACKKQLSFEQFLNYIKENRQAIQSCLLEHGALLFRGFPIENPQAFAEMIRVLQLGKFVNYIGGDSPRDKIADNVYTSTEAPPNFHIPLHQELSFIKNHPHHIYFYCDVPPVTDGETIIGDARQIAHQIDPAIVAKFKEKGLLYTSRYYFESKIMQTLNRWQRSHKSWTEVFETREPAEVEKKCLANDFEWHWLPKHWLEIVQKRPSFHKHPKTQQTVWFNQVHLYDFNPRLLGLRKYIAAKLFYYKKSTRLHEVTFADQTKIPRSDIYHIMDVLEKNTVYFPWKKGDVLVLDNILAMHGRAPFQGKRRILTAMTSTYD